MGEADLVPQARLSGPMPWVIAIMITLTVIAAAAGFALRNIANATAAELAGGITVQIVEADPGVRDRQAEAALDALSRTAGVTNARLVPQEEVDALVEPWLGSGANAEAVPVPALIDARLTGTISGERIRGLAQNLRAVAPAARVDAQSSWLRPVFGAIASLQWLALALIVLLALATAAAVLLAARTALGSNRDTIEVVHLLGGTDAQIARVFQRSIAVDAAGGGAVGLALGLGVILFLGRRFAALGAGMVAGGTLDWLDWVLLALIPVAGVILAMLTARLTVIHALKRML
ncbi:MAG TPA: cell division protein [Novosphingobium sp.]|nr:cell division protein [Novosphingobium sp.]